jgi:hypothetical protein
MKAFIDLAKAEIDSLTVSFQAQRCYCAKIRALSNHLKTRPSQKIIFIHSNKIISIPRGKCVYLCREVVCTLVTFMTRD